MCLTPYPHLNTWMKFRSTSKQKSSRLINSNSSLPWRREIIFSFPFILFNFKFTQEWLHSCQNITHSIITYSTTTSNSPSRGPSIRYFKQETNQKVPRRADGNSPSNRNILPMLPEVLYLKQFGWSKYQLVDMLHFYASKYDRKLTCNIKYENI